MSSEGVTYLRVETNISSILIPRMKYNDYNQ